MGEAISRQTSRFPATIAISKGPNLSAIDPVTMRVVRLFHPRKQKWKEHFFIQGLAVQGLTPIGRATVRLLNMNAARRMELRFALGGKVR